jgi:hypothetical protein
MIIDCGNGTPSYHPIPTTPHVCFRRDVSWWLSFKETPASFKQPATPTLVAPSVSRISTRGISAEVANLNEEILYLLRLQSLVEIASLHLKICHGALEQCLKVHDDRQFGHVQFWELLNLHCGKADMKGDRSRIKHICRLYLEKVSNLLLLAGGLDSSIEFSAISAHVPRIKYSAFRDQMMYRFKDSWNVNVHKVWEDSMNSTPRCCQGEFSGLTADWTHASATLLQDVLARLCDHSIALFPESKTKNSPDPMRQAGILPLINSSKSEDEKRRRGLATFPLCEPVFSFLFIAFVIFVGPCFALLLLFLLNFCSFGYLDRGIETSNSPKLPRLSDDAWQRICF